MWRFLLSAMSSAQVDVYSFSMIAYQLFELTPPFSGMDPVDAARKAALAEERPPLMRLATNMPTMKVSRLQQHLSGYICTREQATLATSDHWHPLHHDPLMVLHERPAPEEQPLLMLLALQTPTIAAFYGQQSLWRTQGSLLLLCGLISKDPWL